MRTCDEAPRNPRPQINITQYYIDRLTESYTTIESTQVPLPRSMIQVEIDDFCIDKVTELPAMRT